MPTADERVSVVETKVDELARGLEAVRLSVVHLEQRIDHRFDALERRFEAVDRRFEVMDEKMTRHFTWLVGIMVMMLAANVAALAAMVAGR